MTAAANAWWRNLSINQMKELEHRYFPWWSLLPTNSMIQKMWEKEGKPAPQALILTNG